MISSVVIPTSLQVKLARVTKRVHEAYFAQLYLTKVIPAGCCFSSQLLYFQFSAAAGIK